MNARKTIRNVAALGLTLIGATVAHAQGSTDISTTNFQQAYATGRATQGAPGATLAAGPTDIYSTNFQRAFATTDSRKVASAGEAHAGSTDIYGTNFQIRYM